MAPGPVVISPNPVKTKVQIDQNGNIVKPFTKEVIQPAPAPDPTVGPPDPLPQPTAPVSAAPAGPDPFAVPSDYGYWKGRPVAKFSKTELLAAFLELAELYRKAIGR